MTRPPLFLVVGIAIILLLLGAGVGAWVYLFGANEVDADELVPANTVVFATIPNAATIALGYQTSQLKTLVESPNSKPLRDSIVNSLGETNLDLLNAFLPNLSGQSFIAITHLDSDKPEKIGFIAGMKPKSGLGDFDGFIDKLKATWPDFLKQGTTGTGSVLGVDYQWIQGPGAPDKLCVARTHGWIITAWGEASLQDWIERYRKSSSTSSLADDVNYRKSRSDVGDNPMTLLYVNNHALVDVLQKQVAKTNPAMGDYLAKKATTFGGAAIATRFENGEIVDHISILIPRPVLINAGMSSQACPFETLKFAGPDTRLYWASSIDWKQLYNHLKEQISPPVDQVGEINQANQSMKDIFTSLHSWVHDSGLDTQKNIVDALGSEISLQVEWSADATYPEAGLFVKLDKPDDFKPTINAIIDSMRKANASTAVVKELSSNGQNFACLQYVQASAFSPTITEDGPYLGIFLTANQAVRSFQRDESIGLARRPEFVRQIGDKRNGATQICFLDAPHLLDRGYQVALPYLSLVSMLPNNNLSSLLKGKEMPNDLSWLAPMGTWSCVITSDEDGLEGYSVSGIGNQGILLGGALGGTTSVLQGMGLLPKVPMPGSAPHISGITIAPATPSPVLPISPQPAGTMPADTNQVTAPVEPATMTNTAPEATPPTNAASASTPPINSTTNAPDSSPSVPSR